MRKKQFQLKNYILVTGIFILSIVAGILIFFTYVQRSVEVSSRKRMLNNVSRQSEHLETILGIHYQYLQEIAAVMGKSEDLFCQENIDRLTSLYKGTDLERVALIDAKGNAHYDTGVVKNVSHRRYFQEALSGQQTLSDPLESSIDQENRVVLGVPIFKDGEVVGVLGGSYNVTALSHMLFDDLFGGTGNSLIVTKEGDIIASDTGSASQESSEYGSNLLTYYEEKKLRGSSVIERIREDFQNAKENLVTLDLKNQAEADCYLAYMPLGMNDWMICYVVPIKVAQQDYDFIKKYEVIFMGSFCVLVVLLMFYLAFKNRQENVELVNSAQKDALTGLYNKKYTQSLIDEMVQDCGKGQIHGFLILDMDHFKEINDTCGHAVGDKVLGTFGTLLQKQFRDQDIAGRIGGDEFVVLVHDIGSRRTMENRVQELLKKIRMIQIPELEGRNLTASIGVAFAPEDGDSFMELYCCADSALYQTKRGGRNGYSIYEKTMN